MTIRTYGNQLISRWQSALYSVLKQDGEAVDNLGSDHPAMAASCVACDEIEHEMMEPMHQPRGQLLASPIETSDLMRECVRLFAYPTYSELVKKAFARFLRTKL